MILCYLCFGNVVIVFFFLPSEFVVILFKICVVFEVCINAPCLRKL